MIQAIGLTSLPRRHQLRPAVDDLTFEARPGRVTVLLGPEDSGKTTALRLMLQLQPGRGTALFRGRPVHRIQHLAREVGVLLGEVNGNPGRTVRGHLRMLAAAAGVHAGRADDVLDVVGLSGLADQRMGALSRGMDRRLGVACALLGDPHTLVLDEPAHELSPRETAWMHSLLRGYANQGGTVLVTSRRSEEAAGLADRVVSIGSGRLLADQEAADFARTRLRPRVAVRTPHVDRLVAVLTQEGRRAGKDRDGGPLKVVHEGGTKVSVYGSSCAEVGEQAYKNNILVHQLTDERGDAGDIFPPAPLHRADGRRLARETPAHTVPTVATHSRQQRASADGNGLGPGPVRDTSPKSEPAGPRSERDTGEAADPGAEDVLRALEELDEFDEFDDLHASTGPDAPADSDSDSDSDSDFDLGAGQADPVDSVDPDETDSRTGAQSSEQSESDGQHAPTEPPAATPPSLDGDSQPSTSEAVPGAASGPGPEGQAGSSSGPAFAPGSVPSRTTAASSATSASPEPPGSSLPASVGTASKVAEPAPAAAASTGPAADSTPTHSEAPTIRLSDAPLTGPSPEPATEGASTENSVTDPAGGTSSDSGESRSSAARPVVMKPLADPYATGRSKSPWTPRRSPGRAAAELPPPLHAVTRPGPVAPLRYELCRLFSVRSTWIAVAVTVAVALCVSLVMARTGLGLPLHTGDSLTPAVRLLTGWPSGEVFLLPPVAVAAGLLGAFAFGEEFRYPALAPARSPVPRRLGLLGAKLTVSAALAVLLGATVAVVNAAGVSLFFGSGALALPSAEASSTAEGSWQLHLAAVFAFTVGCAWAGVLASGIFRSGTVGTAVVVAVPLLLAPVVRSMLGNGSATGPSTEGLPERLETAMLVPWPPGTERWVAALLDVAFQPVGSAMLLLLAALLTAYLVTALTGRTG